MTAVVTVVFTSCPTRSGQQRNQFRTHTGQNGLSVSLPETQVNRANCQNISVVKNESFMRNKVPVFLCPNIYGQQKYPVRNMSGNIGYIKIGVFSEKNTVSEYLGCPNI